jgi:hypothetical protein
MAAEPARLDLYLFQGGVPMIPLFRLPGRVLAMWSLALFAWATVQVLASGGTWALGLGLAATSSAGLALVVSAGFRRATARPLRVRGLEGWLVRRPRWLAACIIWAAHIVVPVVIIGGMALHFHRFPHAYGVEYGLGDWCLIGVGAAAFQLLVWRQRELSWSRPGPHLDRAIRPDTAPG